MIQNRAVGGGLGGECFGVVERFAANSTSPDGPARRLIPPGLTHGDSLVLSDALGCGHNTVGLAMVRATGLRSAAVFGNFGDRRAS
jgi:hypothetical protein